MWPGQTRLESCWWQSCFVVLCFTFLYVMHYSFLLVLRFREIGQNWRTKCKISRLSLLVSRPWSGPLRHVCGHTNHRTTISHTSLKSPTDLHLDVHPGKRFARFGQNCRNWRLRSGHPKQQNLLSATEPYIYPPAMFSTFISSLCILLAHGG